MSRKKKQWDPMWQRHPTLPRPRHQPKTVPLEWPNPRIDPAEVDRVVADAAQQQIHYWRRQAEAAMTRTDQLLERIYPDLIRREIWRSMPVFLKDAFPGRVLLTVIRKEGPSYMRMGWVDVPMDVEVVAQHELNTFGCRVAFRSRSQWHQLFTTGHLVVCAVMTANDFQKFPDRVHLGLDRLYWPAWDPDDMRVVPDDALVPAGQVAEEYLLHLPLESHVGNRLRLIIRPGFDRDRWEARTFTSDNTGSKR